MTEQQKAKFEVSDILYLALTLVVAGIGIAFGLNVLNETKPDLCAAGSDYNATADKCQTTGNASSDTTTDALEATQNAVTGVAKFTDKMGLIATVIVAAVVIGILVRYLFVKP